jgi:hypothetical protein
MLTSPDDRGGSADATSARRLVIVSYLAHAPFSPRGIRTRALHEHLQNSWKVELIAGPAPRPAAGEDPSDGRTHLRKILQVAHASLLLDKYEFWSRRRFRSWRPDAEAALLVGFPFSPLVYASRRLIKLGIPYVVDAGDPWVLTSSRPVARGLGLIRGRRAEYRLWAGAVGGVVTTDAQAHALSSIFPRLPILVRPNGFSSRDFPPFGLSSVPRANTPDSVLRLAHFGDISSERVEIASFLQLLTRSGEWNEIQFHQFGFDWTGALATLPDVTVVFHHPRPWREIVAAAGKYDLAVVIGNRDPMLLPSKAMAYLQLPIPRLALVDDDAKNELTRYAAGKPGWLVVRVRAPDAAERIERHLSRRWTDSELAPPASESWADVSKTVGQFLDELFGSRALPSPTALSKLRAGH